MLEGGEAVVASRGATVRVISVVSDPLATPFRQLEPPEARERQLAYIGVESPDGEWRLADRPLVLVAEAATALQVRAGDYAAAYRSLVGKLERRTGIDDLELIIETPKDSWPKVTGPMTQAYADAFIALAEAVKSADEQAYGGFGYMMARAEMELEILPAATRGLQAGATLDLAASARRLEGNRVRSILQSHAAAVIAANPDISLGGCSRLVGARLAADETWTLGSDPKWIQARIKPLFELRANGREYRPRRPLEGERSTVKGG